MSFGTVDVEKIVSLDPDLVIAGGAGFTSADAIAKLRSLKIPVLVVSSTTLESIYTDLALVGTRRRGDRGCDRAGRRRCAPT